MIAFVGLLLHFPIPRFGFFSESISQLLTFASLVFRAPDEVISHQGLPRLHLGQLAFALVIILDLCLLAELVHFGGDFSQLLLRLLNLVQEFFRLLVERRLAGIAIGVLGITSCILQRIRSIVQCLSHLRLIHPLDGLVGFTEQVHRKSLC